jgi:adenylate kinase family enzyme
MVKYDKKLLKTAIELFPRDLSMHEMIKKGSVRVIEHIHKQIKFYVDEDDIIRAFRNKNEKSLLEYAQRSKDVRQFYQEVVESFDENHEKLSQHI